MAYFNYSDCFSAFKANGPNLPNHKSSLYGSSGKPLRRYITCYNTIIVPQRKGQVHCEHAGVEHSVAKLCSFSHLSHWRQLTAQWRTVNEPL